MRYWIYGLVAAMCLAMIAAVQVKKVYAHSWYDPECCHMMDCAPVTSVSFVAADPKSPPQMVVTTIHGTAVVSQQTKRRESKDSQLHACITLHVQVKNVRCIYMPPSL